MNKEFVWTDDLVKEFAAKQAVEAVFAMSPERRMSIEEFKASHTEVKRDWEILTFGEYYSNSCTVFYHKDKSGLFVSGVAEETENHLLVKKNVYIQSVRRLSDNEVFSVGDYIKSKVNDNKPFIVEKIQIINNDFIYLDNCPLANATKPLQRTPDSIKPPIGIMPEYIWKEQRLYELNQAIIRYINAGLSYPKEWGFERETLINETKPKQ